MTTGNPGPRTRQRKPRAGTFERDMEQANIDAEAARLRSLRLSYPQIAERMGCAVSTAEERVKRALAAVPVESVRELRLIELDALDDQYRRMYLIATQEHYARGMWSRSGEYRQGPVDRCPNIAALRELRLIAESRRKLLGIDAPEQKLLVVKDSVAQEIERLAEELGLSDAQKAEAASAA